MQTNQYKIDKDIIYQINQIVVTNIQNGYAYSYELANLSKLVFYSANCSPDCRLDHQQLAIIIDAISSKIHEDSCWLYSDFIKTFCLLILGIKKYGFTKNHNCKIQHQIFDLLVQNGVLDDYSYKLKYKIELLYNLDTLNVDKQGLIKQYILRFLQQNSDQLMAHAFKENILYCLKMLDIDDPTKQQIIELDKIYSHFKQFQRYSLFSDVYQRVKYQTHFEQSVDSLFMILEFDPNKNNYQQKLTKLYIERLIRDYKSIKKTRTAISDTTNLYSNRKYIFKYLYIQALRNSSADYMIKQHDLYSFLNIMVCKLNNSELIQLIDTFQNMSQYVSRYSFDLLCMAITTKTQKQVQLQNQELDRSMITICNKYIQLVSCLDQEPISNGIESIAELDRLIARIYDQHGYNPLAQPGHSLVSKQLIKYNSQLGFLNIESEVLQLFRPYLKIDQ